VIQHIVQRHGYFSPATPIIAVTQHSDKYSFIFAYTSHLISLILFLLRYHSCAAFREKTQAVR